VHDLHPGDHVKIRREYARPNIHGRRVGFITGVLTDIAHLADGTTGGAINEDGGGRGWVCLADPSLAKCGITQTITRTDPAA
jgi:hypothetical protein